MINTIFKFGSNIVTFKKGTKHANDYLIYHNDVQIPDLSLFDWIAEATTTEAEAVLFLKAFTGCKNISFKKEAILTTPSPLDKDAVYDYSIKIDSINERLRELLFVSILRCDIDNICYSPPKYNGGIRIFTQILLLYAYTFKWQQHLKIHPVKIKTPIPKFIFDIGFPSNIYGVTKNTFKNIYKAYVQSGII